MKLADSLKARIRQELLHYRDNPDAAAHAISWMLCREAYARGFVKGVECGKAFPHDDKSGTLEEGHWFAGYAFEEQVELPPEEDAA